MPPTNLTYDATNLTYDATRVTGRRIVQFLLDGALTGIILGLVGLVGNSLYPAAHFGQRNPRITKHYGLHAASGWPSVIALLLTIIVWLIVFVAIPARTDRTPAMRLLGLRITRLDGSRPSAGQHLARALLLFIDTIGAGLLGWIVILCSSRRQRVGDHAAGTVVVRSPREFTALGDVGYDPGTR